MRLDVDHETDLRARLRSKREHRRTVRAHQIVRHARRLEDVAMSRSEAAVHVASVHHYPRLIERGPHRNPITEYSSDRLCVFGEPIGDVAIEPAAAIIERRGKIPVVECRERNDVVREQRVDETLVEREALGVHSSGSVGKHSRPRDAEAIGAESEAGEKRNVLVPTLVVIAGDVTGRVAMNKPGRVAEAMPDARTGAIGEGRAFDLIGRRRGAPEKARRELVGPFAHYGTANIVGRIAPLAHGSLGDAAWLA